jgi:hypothetical protein
MRPIVISLLLVTAAMAETRSSGRGLAADSAEDHRERLKEYLAAYRRLSPAAKEQVRQLDKDLQNEEGAERTRLLGVMERYTLWLSRLSDADRARVSAAPAGPERLQVVSEIRDQQWLDNLPPARKEFMAKASAAERTEMLRRWRTEDHERQQNRAWELQTAQDMLIPGQPERRKQFHELVVKYVKSDLEPKLGPNEKANLQKFASRGGTSSYAYLHRVWVLSKAHGLTPPGSPEIWAVFSEGRPRP